MNFSALGKSASITGIIKSLAGKNNGLIGPLKPQPITPAQLKGLKLATLESDIFIRQTSQSGVAAKIKPNFNGIFTDFAMPGRKLDISEFFDNGVFKTEIAKDGKKLPIHQIWNYNEAEDSLKIVDAFTNKTLMETDSAYEYFDRLIELQKLVKSGKISDFHFGLYLSESPSVENIGVITDAIKHQNNETLVNLLNKYKTGHKRFQTYERCKTSWKDRKKLAAELEKIALNEDINVVRFEGWGFFDSIPLANGKTLGSELKRLQAANASEAELDAFVSTLGPVQNKDFLSTALNSTTGYFERKPIMYNLKLPQGTKGVYLEDIIDTKLISSYESEFLVQKEQFINIKKIRFENGTVVVDAEILPTKISK